MRFISCPSTIIAPYILLSSCLTTAVSIDCSSISVNDISYNLQALEGPHSVSTIRKHPPGFTNTTFNIDVCRPLQKSKGAKKDHDCPNGSRVCAIQYLTDTEEDKTTFENAIPIAGEYSHTVGGSLDPKWTRMQDSPSSADHERQGIILELHGGKDSSEKTKQKAIIEFICNADEIRGVQRRERVSSAADEDKDNDKDEDDDNKADQSHEETDDGHGGKLKFYDWQMEGEIKVLRLQWTTKYACEGAEAGDDKSATSHWGFFTWLIIILFMGVATYLIFGSWLNYNRYSARGWDLLPHSETIRDLPYLMKDFLRRIVNAIQGGGSRGGYSAV